MGMLRFKRKSELLRAGRARRSRGVWGHICCCPWRGFRFLGHWAQLITPEGGAEVTSQGPVSLFNREGTAQIRQA